MNHSPDAVQVFEAMKTTDDRRQFERYQVIHLHLMEYIQKSISTIVGRSVKTVPNYIQSYRKCGL